MSRILLTGATGYVGGRLLTQLVARGHSVRCLVRDPARLVSRGLAGVEVVAGDVLDASSVSAAMDGMEAAYYLVHSMGEASGFEARDLEGARHFAAAANAAGVGRVIYLGGLGDDHDDLSPHLRSRQEVGRVLRQSGVPTIELRASIVIGSGSLSFEMIRALTEHLPVMVTPRWTSVLSQPIGIRDLLDYLVQALDVPLVESVIVEIGGSDQVSYLGLMREYARQRGLRRLMIRVPLLTPRLSSLWLGLVTPVYARVGRKLIESIKHPTVVRTDTASRLFSVKPCSAAEAMRAALANEDHEHAETRWSDAVSASGTARGGDDPQGPSLVDRRHVDVPASPRACFEVIEGLGGRNGWPAYDSLWRLRGFLDLLVGGVGMRRGRPEGRPLRVGDALDFWRVAARVPGERLRLSAEMKVPGRAWLEFTVEPRGSGARIIQTATFEPAGFPGRAYWYGVYPLHRLVFAGMLAGLAARARSAAAKGAVPALLLLMLHVVSGAAAASQSGGASSPASPGPAAVETVPSVDLDRYLGTWYEAARFDNRFQRSCESDVTATYARRPDGRLDVVNRCRTADGSVTSARGVARVVDSRTRARLKVRFAPAFLSWLPVVWGDYWVIGLAADYSWAVVGTPDRKYLWVLSRTPLLEKRQLEQALARARANGFDTERLMRTAQRFPPSDGAPANSSAR